SLRSAWTAVLASRPCLIRNEGGLPRPTSAKHSSVKSVYHVLGTKCILCAGLDTHSCERDLFSSLWMGATASIETLMPTPVLIFSCSFSGLGSFLHFCFSVDWIAGRHSDTLSSVEEWWCTQAEDTVKMLRSQTK